MTGDLGSPHREAHSGEEAPLLPVPDVTFRLLVWLRGCSADRVEAELGAEQSQLGSRHDRILHVKAIRIHEDGGPEVLRYEDVPDPVAGPGEVLVSLRAASLNHLDLWVRKGLPSVPKPRILGADGAGIRVDTGERVVINPGLEHGAVTTVIGEHTDGTHCELIAVPETNVFPLDDAIDFETAAAFPLVFETAFRMLVTRAKIQRGEWVLIWGIGGGVGTAAFEIARAAGAKTLVTSGSAAKLEAAREWGADLAVPHAEAAAAAKELGGVDLVVETVGEATWKDSLSAVKPGGRVVVCGATTGPNPPAQLHRFWWKQLTVYGSTMGTRDDFLGAYELVRSGRVRVHVDSTFPLAETRAAHERLERGEQLGKIVLTIPG
jgi:NADPH:quinone reductase-like Zn-dependent oxidoreductase